MRALVVAWLALLLVAPAAHGAAAGSARAARGAAGFGQPHVVSSRGGSGDGLVAAVGPTGRTVVAWRDIERERFVARLGAAPGRLGPRRALPGAAVLDVLVAVGPDGTALACWVDERTRLRCNSAAPRAGRFGAPVTVARGTRASRLRLTGLVIDPAGRAVLALHRTVGRGRWLVQSVVGRPGALGRAAARGPGRPHPQTLGSTDADGEATLSSGPDGATIASFSRRADGTVEYPRRPVLAVLPAGAATFGVPLDPADGQATTGAARPLGGFVAVDLDDEDSEYGSRPYARALGALGGAAPFGPLTPLTGVPRGETQIAGILPGPTAVTVTTRGSASDCDNTTFGQILAGPFDAPRRLSGARQIALEAQTATLDEGLEVIAWVDQALPQGRLEYALRAPGAPVFSPGRPLPVRVTDADPPAFVLATGGRHALLAWTTGPVAGATRIVAAPLRRTPPYAARAPRPSHPRTQCN